MRTRRCVFDENRTKEFIDAALDGVSPAQQVRSNVDAAKWRLSAAELDEIDVPLSSRTAKVPA